MTLRTSNSPTRVNVSSSTIKAPLSRSVGAIPPPVSVSGRIVQAPGTGHTPARKVPAEISANYPHHYGYAPIMMTKPCSNPANPCAVRVGRAPQPPGPARACRGGGNRLPAPQIVEHTGEVLDDLRLLDDAGDAELARFLDVLALGIAGHE